MTLKDLQKLETLQSRGVNADTARDPRTLKYLQDCIRAFYAGDFGEIPPEDVQANLEDIQAGTGHCYARYKQYGTLTADLIIEAMFSEDYPGDINYNYVMLCYLMER